MKMFLKISYRFLIAVLVLVLNQSCLSQESIHFILKKDKKKVVKTELAIQFQKTKGDSILVIFESGFKYDLVTVYANDKDFGSKKLVSDQSLGLADTWSLPPKSHAIGIGIGRDRLSFPSNDKFKYVFVNKRGDEIIIEFGDALPLYD